MPKGRDRRSGECGPTHHVLDWFHLSMRVQHVAQAAKGWPDASADDRQAGAYLADTIERIRWRLWHGQVGRAWISLAKLWPRSKPGRGAVAGCRGRAKVARVLGDLETYVSGNPI